MKYKLCVSGAAETTHCGKDSLELAKETGREIVRQGGVLVTGATTGLPYWAAIGAKEEGGISIGLSPASTEREHVEHYKLPVDYMDMIVYTGFGYPGRNLMLTRASDAVIIGCGRVGTLDRKSTRLNSSHSSISFSLFFFFFNTPPPPNTPPLPLHDALPIFWVSGTQSYAYTRFRCRYYRVRADGYL